MDNEDWTVGSLKCNRVPNKQTYELFPIDWNTLDVILCSHSIIKRDSDRLHGKGVYAWLPYKKQLYDTSEVWDIILSCKLCEKYIEIIVL